MASVFSHRDDGVIRVGDYVRTTTGASSLPVAEPANGGAHGRSSTLGGRRSATPSSRPRQRPASEKLTVAQAPHSTAGASSNGTLEHSTVCDLFKADTSSVDAWWTTMTRGTWLQQSTEAIRVGVVRSVNLADRSVEVTVWMLGDRCLVECPKKPIETFPCHRLEKLSIHEFNEVCRKRFMHAMAHQLKLRGEGYDESAPFALIAHNNRVISELIGKIDTSAKLSLKDIKLQRPRGPADLIKRPIPVMVPVEDPLAAARGELQALQENGLVQGARRRRHQPSEFRTHHNKSSGDDGLVHGTERHVSTPMVGEAPVALSPAPTHAPSTSAAVAGTVKAETPQPQRSFFEGSLSDATTKLQRTLRASSALTRPNAGLHPRQPMVPDRFFGRTPSSTGLGRKASQSAFLTSVQSMDVSMIERHHVLCTVIDVMPCGWLLLRPSRTSDVPFVATLAFVDIWRDRSAVAAINALAAVEAKVYPITRDIHGNCLCDVFVNGECLAETLLEEGYATLNVSAIDAHLLDEPTSATMLQPERLEAFRAAQDNAAREKRGVWKDLEESMLANSCHVTGEADDADETAADAHQRPIKPNSHLPPLFGAFESSHGFRQQLSATLLSGK